MLAAITIPEIAWRGLLPIVTLVGSALLVLLLDAFLPAARSRLKAIALLALVFALYLTCGFLARPPLSPFPGSFAADDFAHFFDLLFYLAAIGAMGLSLRARPALDQGEYWGLLLLATAGMVALAHAASLVVVFLALELLSVVLYALTGYLHEQVRSAEAALKYFFLGAFSASFLVFGMGLIYAATGSLEIAEIGRRIAQHAAGQPGAPLLLMAGVALLFIGFGFKISSVPFHMWTPDVYHGAPTAVAAFMSVATKAAAFAALLRVFVSGFGPLSAQWRMGVAVVAVLTMMVGNLTALTQSNLKRLLAFSSIAHAGYALVGLVAWERAGAQATLFYLLAYTFMNLGAFGLVAALERPGEETYVHDLAGLARRRPLLAAAMAVFLLSLAGVPPTAGFQGKLALFLAAVDAGWTGLAVLAVVYSAIAAYFYLRIIVFMYMEPEPARAGALERVSRPAAVVFVVALLGVLTLGWMPSSVLVFLDQAVRSL